MLVLAAILLMVAVVSSYVIYAKYPQPRTLVSQVRPHYLSHCARSKVICAQGSVQKFR